MKDRLLEKAAKPVAAIMLAGAMALGAAGCKPDGEQAATPQPAATFEVPEGADQLPVLPNEEDFSPSLGDSYISTSGLTYNLEKDDYEWIFNTNPDTDETDEYFPGGKSAPILDVMLGHDGKLHYDSHVSQTSDFYALLETVASAEPFMGTALRSGQVSKLRFRAFDPREDHNHPYPRLYLHDYTDGGRSNVYFFLDGNISGQTTSYLLSHEFSHALLGQSEAVQPSPEEVKAFTEACGVMQKSALKHMSEDSAWIVSGLEQLQSMVPEKYGPAFQAVSRAVEDAKYNRLPNGGLRPQIDGLPACFMEDPWFALTDNIRDKNINGGKIPSAMNTQEFEDGINEIVADWNDLLKESQIYNALSESTYLDHDPDTSVGHPYNTSLELAASTTNLMLRTPTEFGQHVAELPADLRKAVLSVVFQNVTKLKKRHASDKQFQDFLSQQYGEFLSKV